MKVKCHPGVTQLIAHEVDDEWKMHRHVENKKNKICSQA